MKSTIAEPANSSATSSVKYPAVKGISKSPVALYITLSKSNIKYMLKGVVKGESSSIYLLLTHQDQKQSLHTHRTIYKCSTNERDIPTGRYSEAGE